MKILFAHPDRKLSELYVRHIKQHFLVDSVHDGLAAVRSVKLSYPSLIVSDYHLPMLSGLGLLKFVRQNPIAFATPFIFMSGFHDNTKALSFGANDWLDIKETYPDLLLARIYHHLSRTTFEKRR